jgi:outer membrane autotransporter protein
LAAQDQSRDIQKQYQLFAVLGANDLRYETGSYVKNHGMNAELGFARQLPSGKHTALLMPFVEYGHGNYTSHLDEVARGDGKNTYYGAGLLVRQDNANGMYTEGSLRVGHTQGDYSGAIAGYNASYDLDGTYTAAHIGTGREFQLTDKDSLDVYARFFYTHMNSAETHLHSSLGSAPYEFDSVNSYRSRIGTRWTRNYRENQSLYAGLAWDYEFGSGARASYHDLTTLSPEVKGGSGMVELGWSSKASQTNPWSADVRLTQWMGKQKGTQFSVGAQYHF